MGNNRGIVYAMRKHSPKYILLLNNDTKIVNSDWLRKMVITAESVDVGIVGCRLISPDGETQYIGTKMTQLGPTWLRPSHIKSYPDVFDVDGALGACFLIKTALIDKIGGFDPGFSPFIVGRLTY